MRYILFLFVVAACFFVKGLLAHGQPAPVSNDMGVPPPADAAAGSLISPQELSDLVADAKAYRAAKSANDKHGTAMALALILAAVGKLLIDQLKRVKTNELTDKAKAAIPILLTVLGGGVAVAWHYGKGDDWTTALLVGGGAPGMVLVHELLDALVTLCKKKPPAAPENKKPDIAPPPQPQAA